MSDQTGAYPRWARRLIGAYFVTCCLVMLGCIALGIDTYLLGGLVLGGRP